MLLPFNPTLTQSPPSFQAMLVVINRPKDDSPFAKGAFPPSFPLPFENSAEIRSRSFVLRGIFSPSFFGKTSNRKSFDLTRPN